MQQQISLILKTQKSATFFLFCITIILFNTRCYAQGTWTPLVTPAPDYNHGVMVLLTDGTVLAKTSSGGDYYGDTWDRLTPDANGSYVNGTWSTPSSMLNTRLYFSTQVLQNGTLYVAGGEYGTGRAAGEIYYPQADYWLQAPAFPYLTDTISDANSEILPNGKVLQAIVISGYYVSQKTYIYDPVANTYTVGPLTQGVDNESAWVKLPDNSILFVNISSTNSERYIPATNTWIADSSLPVGLYDPFGSESGAAFLLPDGRAFFIGSTSHSAYYTPSGTTSPGRWTAGPNIPDSLGAPDAAAAMMVNGKILCAFSHTPDYDSVFQTPTSYYEFDYVANTFTQIMGPDTALVDSIPSYFSNMLCLPDGNILYCNQGDDQYYIYTPGSAPLAAGKPTVDTTYSTNCDTFIATGTLFNGITEGAGYGDDWQMASNYPIIRLTSNDSVFYATTYYWNSTGVMRGTSPDTTQFVLPLGLPEETFSLQVVANGNASDPVSFSPVCNVSGVKKIAKPSSNINVYPNPASEQANVIFNSINGGEYDLKLLDVYGRVVLEKNEVAVTGENTYSMQLDRIAKGIYTVIIRDGSGVYDTKLVIR